MTTHTGTPSDGTPSATARSDTLSGIRRVVIAVDDTPEGYGAAQLAAAWLPPDVEAVVLHVAAGEDVDRSEGPPPAGSALGGYPVAPLGDLHERISDDPDAELEVARRAARVAGATASTRTGDPAAQILAAARDTDADLIVMGAHHQTLLGRLFSTDTTSDVVEGSPCPVLVAGPNATT